jgi:hypothetical protein
MNTELLPCPFCGGDAEHGTIEYSARAAVDIGNGTQRRYHFCNCTACGVSNAGITGHASRGDAIAAWNRRAVMEPQP